MIKIPELASGNSNGRHLVFVGGAPRSGTTLVQRILNAHPQIYGGTEFGTNMIAELRNRFMTLVKRDKITEIADEETLNDGFRALILTIFNRKLVQTEKEYFTEKTPANVLEFETLMTLFPEAKFVLVLRDPRAVAASMKKGLADRKKNNRTYPSGFRDAASRAEMINHYWQAGFAALEKTQHTQVVYYEDIVQQPEVEAQKLCSLIGVPYDAAMVEIEKSSFDYGDASNYKGLYSEKQLTSPIQKDRLKSYEKVLSPAEIALTEKLVKDHPLLARYDLTRESLPAAAMALCASTLLQKQLLAFGKSGYRRLRGY